MRGLGKVGGVARQIKGVIEGMGGAFNRCKRLFAGFADRAQVGGRGQRAAHGRGGAVVMGH